MSSSSEADLSDEELSSTGSDESGSDESSSESGESEEQVEPAAGGQKRKKQSAAGHGGRAARGIDLSAMPLNAQFCPCGA
jgi:hypothetical protein